MPIVSRRELIAAAAAAAAGGALPQWTVTEDNVLAAPDDPAAWPAYREALRQWRADARARLAYSDALYRRPDLKWAARAFTCAFLMLCDEALYDRRRRRWRAGAFLRQQQRAFGPLDAAVLWQAYPRIGLDDRNQFDMYRDQPGGLDGLRALADDLHRAGVRVFIDYNPWDTGTRREGVSDVESLARLVKAIGADGIFLDTMAEGASELRPRLDAARPGVALEGEIALPLARIHDHHLSWAQWFGDSPVPGVLRNKWFERRHMQHRIDRWNRDHTLELQSAWMNGSGMLVWENVFGSWVGWSERDRSMLRRMTPIQRRYADLFTGEGWTPLVSTLHASVFASLWEARGIKLWTLVNRADRPVEGPLLAADAVAGGAWFDLWSGAALPGGADGAAQVPGRLDARGLGAILCARPDSLGPGFGAFLASQRRLAGGASGDTAFPARTAALVPPRQSRRGGASGAHGEMAPVPATRTTLTVEFRVRECGFYDAQSPLGLPGGPGLHTRATFARDVDLPAYRIGVTPVTNAQFARFIRETGYRPADAANFLKHWARGAPPDGREDHPVVWVDLEDARAYARWADARLPTEEEWQVAAQGADGREWPWGPSMASGRCNGGEAGGTTPVTAFPAGASPCGCLDMCGNTWEWTESERSDGRTRFAILKGGSHYRAEGSDWYFDGGPRPCRWAAKVLLAGPGLDRAATVGFRCAAGDAAAR